MVLVLIITISIILRLALAGKYADSWDTVDFALGLSNFDLLSMQPHFPGYPIYMFFGILIYPLIGDQIETLSLISAVSGGLLILPVFYLSTNLFGKSTGWMAAILTAVHPLIWLLAEVPMSDMMGILFIYLYLWLISISLKIPLADKDHEKILFAGAALYALAMGIRISYFPYVFMLLIPLLRSIMDNHKPWVSFWRGLLITGITGAVFVSLWFVPLALHEGGIIPFLQLGLRFTEGHFTQWGGTILTSGDWVERLYKFLVQLGFKGWFGIITDQPIAKFILLAIFILGLVITFIKWKNRRQRENNTWAYFFLFLSVIPYFIWIMVGQNVDKIRHIVILSPVFMILLAKFIAILRDIPQKIWLAIFAVFFFVQGLSLSYEYRTTIPPMVQLADYLNQRYVKQNMLIFTWEEERVIDFYFPEIKTEKVQSVSYFKQTVLNYGKQEELLVTNSVLNGFKEQGYDLYPLFNEVAVFQGNSLLYPNYNQIVLYEAKPELYQWLNMK
ncbi:glycosyltransferase family 39 protein [Microaerobacter geothermalis]|uniref:ArnT family glycosyltransferase n=1 Tax=Microaerobacter geothermalis TaxID=674972 RepID=UPI001F18F9CE|nr:glycosyltransferase family 39 protein [Microaerobacter geothermalis]MCF6095134.1 glycosyltransferase family 39 protein [Microaerobacter geothermalis]